MKKNILLAGFIAGSLAAILTTLAHFQALPIPEGVLMTARWTAIPVLIAYDFLHGSLTPWLLVSMLVAGEFAHASPQATVHLKVRSQIFLRLITLVIPPLLFRTLFTGIAD